MKSVFQLLHQNEHSRMYQSEEWKGFARRIRRDRGNSCQCCKRSDVITQVHHLFYEPGRSPWEYANDEVVLLCQGCHGQLHEQLKAFRKNVFQGLRPREFQLLNGALSVALRQYDPLTFMHALCEFVSNPRLVNSHAEAWRK